jgi:hypothetical protein
MITVMDVFRSMRIHPTKSEAWSAGGRTARQYRRTYGVNPPKIDRPKTDGVGTHAFAGYPPKWRSVIKSIIRGVMVGLPSR